MAKTAQTWQARPSDLLRVVDDVTAYALDEALALRLQVDHLAQLRRPAAPKPPPPGTRWATEADYPDDQLAFALADSQAANE